MPKPTTLTAPEGFVLLPGATVAHLAPQDEPERSICGLHGRPGDFSLVCARCRGAARAYFAKREALIARERQRLLDLIPGGDPDQLTIEADGDRFLTAGELAERDARARVLANA